ncbi:MAG: hypothetical protein AAF517_21815, partial [Planctomycetota bacterium]
MTSATFLRVCFVVLNLGLATSIAYFYQHKLFEEERVEPDVELHPPGHFSKVRTTPRRSGVDLVAIASKDLLPVRPPVQVVQPDNTVDETPPVVTGGPLSKDWEFDWCLIDRVDPRNTVVRIRKKPADSLSTRRIGTIKGQTIRRTKRLTKRPSSRRTKRDPNTVVVRIGLGAREAIAQRLTA